MQFYRNKEKEFLAVEADYPEQRISIDEDGRDVLLDMNFWEIISAKEFMKDIGKLREELKVAKKIVEENVPSIKILG